MKKAFLDQLFLGFLLLMGIATFVATVSDQTSTRNKIYDLKQIALKTSQALARSYENNMDMCYGKTIAEDILKESSLGLELLNLKDSGDINFEFDYYDMSPINSDGSIGDGEPDTAITTITGYKQSTFWYKFFDKNDFTINQITGQDTVNTPRDVTIRYGARPSASYQNIMGTYELDNNDCVTNMKMYMANSKEWDKWEKLTDPSDPNSPRIPIADGITSPPTYVFAVANGNNKFNNPTDNAPVTLEAPHCFGSATYPRITINGVTMQATVGNTNSGNVFFEHDELNADGYNHFHIIPKTILNDYVNYKNNIYTSSGNEKDKYQAFLNYCTSVNSDADLSNDIGSGNTEDCTNDPNDEYHYALEDLDAGGSDFDFTDMILDSTRLVKKNDTDKYTVDGNQKIIFDSGYCEEDNNTPPTLQLVGCPITIDEDTSTSTISWIVADTDGTIESKDISTSYGLATINQNGTITYTPDKDYYGEDTIIMVVKDNDDAIAKEECKVTITEINDNPTITGTPATSILEGNTYNFLPDAEDVDGDALTFSIINKPSWAVFDTATGQLTGTPSASDIGIFENIRISVSDGRGGTASLSLFNIQVISDNDKPLQTTPIPDHSTIEGEIYTYNLAAHFSDPDGDTLTYTVTISSGGSSQTINAPNGLLTLDIPEGAAGTTVNVHVEVSDGEETITDDYILTITSNSDCNGPFEATFTGTNDDWVGGVVSNNNYRIDGYSSVYVSHFFGQGCKNTNVKITFRYKTNNRWEDDDKFYLYVNGSYKTTYNKTQTNWINKTETAQTDNDGWLIIQFINNANNNNERARIDDVKAEKTN